MTIIDEKVITVTLISIISEYISVTSNPLDSLIPFGVTLLPSFTIFKKTGNAKIPRICDAKVFNIVRKPCK